MILLSFKIMFLLLAVWTTLINVSSVYGKEYVPMLNFLAQAMGITGFVVLQWML